ncbi:MAG TPA: response regulator transcription factor [Candidatus Limnocylindria bacterium]|jgi:DNA-binding response OmpR family regulator|nr:response regulator transcription factor [Candidatus Limnocylindria bacterium]
MRLLVVEDDADLRASVTTALREAGHEVEAVGDGLSADERIAEGGLDAVVLDWMLPGMSGLDVCRRAREAGSDAAIVMLTARDDVPDRVEGLDSGADDYVVKPFAIAELLARVRSVARRTSAQRSAIFTAGPVTLDVAARTVTVHGARIELSAREFDVLELLMRNRERVMTRGEIEEHVWGARFTSTSNVVDVFVRRIRRKLADAAGIVETVRGVGYRLGND